MDRVGEAIEDMQRSQKKDGVLQQEQIDGVGKDRMKLKIGGPCAVTFDEMLVRVEESFKLEVHIDTDEANAAEVIRGQTGTLAATTAQAIIKRVNSKLNASH